MNEAARWWNTVTQQENIRRGASLGAIAVRTNRCQRGHDLAQWRQEFP